MIVNLDLPSELEDELSLEATQLKLPLTEYILRVLSFRPFLQDRPTTGAELVSHWESIGIFDSRPEITDSQAHARQLRHESEHRERS